MLSYHFGSKEGLFVAIVQEAENRQRRLLASSFGTEGLDVADLARRTWRQLRAPELAPLLRLFFELYVQALQGRDYAQPILAGFPDSWVEPMLPGLMALGLTESQARAETRLGIAVIRGLLLDVLATGDVAGADAAHEAYVAMLMARQAQRTGASGDTPA
jgi:AcrR family transcriptional regulator